MHKQATVLEFALVMRPDSEGKLAVDLYTTRLLPRIYTDKVTIKEGLNGAEAISVLERTADKMKKVGEGMKYAPKLHANSRAKNSCL